MNRIRLLSEQVANQIAAGEVVERPASVVKELVENSLDAEATRITVEIQAGGRALIRVTDDGIGMSRDDALLCLERHATSKIQKAEDLHAIYTMGFRGEALPSIASVSRFTLTSRERDSDSPEASQIIISGGKINEVKAAGAAPGTSVEVRQLFFNLPARRKFLRSEETETAHIQHYLTLAALAHPQVAFTFLRDRKLIWQLPALRWDAASAEGRLTALQERLRALHGAGTSFLRIDFTAPLACRDEEESSGASPFRLWGMTGAPGVSRATREDQHLFVNRRPVENRGLNYALLEGYHTALMKGRYPVCCLFLELEPALVDVNIHPSKREVKFRNEREVRSLVTEAIRQTLLNFHTTERTQPSAPAPSVSSFPAQATPTRVPEETQAAAVPEQSGLAFPKTPSSHPNTSLDASGDASRPERSVSPAGPVGPVMPPPVVAAAEPRPATVPPPATDIQTGERESMRSDPLLNVPLRLVGVIGKLYVVFESDRGLVLLDQHAAHERILFEQMLSRLDQGRAPSQRLLLPETVELSLRDADFLREQLPTLSRLGVGLHEFGDRTFLLDALPPFVKAPDPRGFVLALIDELKTAGQQVNNLRLGEDMIAKTVCRHAVKANDPLAEEELEKLVSDLRRCAMPYTCPHGRPTLIEMNYRELEKKFGRQQS